MQLTIANGGPASYTSAFCRDELMIARLAAFVLFFCLTLHASEIKGNVKNAAGGERLERVQVSVLEAGRETNTGTEGTFVIQNLAPGKYTLRVSAVG